MCAKLSNDHLLRISKGNAKAIGNFRLGVRLNQISGLNIDQLCENAAKDRFHLAEQAIKSARWAHKLPKPIYRVALARAYYAMYHAARAVVFFIEGGDDHEAHQVLPQHLPNDFPNRAQWENDLKAARLERNRADYDPYPKTDAAYRSPAGSTLSHAEAFLPIARRYLRRKGCAI